VTGGDINDAYRLTFVDGGHAFLKRHEQAPEAMFSAEAEGLAALARAGALSVPRVLAVHDGAPLAFLLLEWLEEQPRSLRYDEGLGRGLAALHRSATTAGERHFGFHRDNYIGRLPQSNRRHSTFASFYREERLSPLVDAALRARRFDAGVAADFERLYARLDALLGPEASPSLVHGDLWSGNVMVGPDGMPWLIDPAVYLGHRELDLAMMRLFGGFSEAVFASYHEAYPLEPGVRSREGLFQLYPLLVHAVLFGGSYVHQLRRTLSSYL
jgi:fructosamine-3-kinase